jgi:glutathione synthase/RimK-type ligase-like ATP-grasp enzyme
MTMTQMSTPTANERPALIGLARLMTMAFEGTDLAPLAHRLIGRAEADLHDAEALLDLSWILELQGLRDLGLATQAHALQTQRLYELPPRRPAGLRLLAVMAAGDLMTNTPLPFLIEDSDVALSLLYVLPGDTLPADMSAYDAVFIAVSESEATAPLLARLAEAAASWRTPVINRPENVGRCARTQAFERLSGTPGLAIPATVRAGRAELAVLARCARNVSALLPDGAYPLIVRPVDSHAGNDLAKIDDDAAMAAYLDRTAGDAFHLARFVDYRGVDGLYRKQRIVLVDGRAYAGHMAVSEHWMIHYLNAGMTESATKRAEEADFMAGFDTGFARRHAGALRAIAECLGLDYLVLDCAETIDGELLFFEASPGAVVHAMDPVELFPYKRAAMAKVFAAFRALLGERALALR